MQLQELNHCCSAVWMYGFIGGVYKYGDCELKSLEEWNKEIKKTEKGMDRFSWPSKAFILLAISETQYRAYPALLQALVDNDYHPLAASLGAHDTPVYLFCKMKEPLPLPEVPSPTKKSISHPTSKQPLPKEAKFL